MNVRVAIAAALVVLMTMATSPTGSGGLFQPPPVFAADIGPEDDLCAAINGLTPGEELVLSPGDYDGPCTIRQGGAPGAPLVIRAADPTQPPRIVYMETKANVFDIRADH